MGQWLIKERKSFKKQVHVLRNVLFLFMLESYEFEEHLHLKSFNLMIL